MDAADASRERNAVRAGAGQLSLRIERHPGQAGVVGARHRQKRPEVELPRRHGCGRLTSREDSRARILREDRCGNAQIKERFV